MELVACIEFVNVKGSYSTDARVIPLNAYGNGRIMDNGQRRYLAYMLRLWEVSNDGQLAWRASLESPHTGERHGFADLEALFGFLEEQAERTPSESEGNTKKED
jgi:hypothetical protein